MSEDDPDLRNTLSAEFELDGSQALRISQHLTNAIDEEEAWESDIIGPGDGRQPYTEFDPTTGLPIVHSRKIWNYTVNLRRIYKNAELHETILDIVEDAISLHRMLYRIARFLVTESKITLGNLESAVYFLFWKHDVTPIETSDGYDKIGRYLKDEFGEHITEAKYQSCLDELSSAGLITIRNDVIHIIEHPRASHKKRYK